jgi:hypothetical protein
VESTVSGAGVKLRIKAVNRAGDLTMTFAAIENYARPALKPFARYLNYGVSDPDKRFFPIPALPSSTC